MCIAITVHEIQPREGRADRQRTISITVLFLPFGYEYYNRITKFTIAHSQELCFLNFNKSLIFKRIIYYLIGIVSIYN